MIIGIFMSVVSFGTCPVFLFPALCQPCYSQPLQVEAILGSNVLSPLPPRV